MMRGREARIALAGPVSLIAAMLSVAVSIALSDLPPGLAVAVLAVLPVALCFWLCSDLSVGTRILFGSINVAISAGVLAAIFGATRFGMGAIGLMAAMWGSAAVVLLGSLAARTRSGSPLLGTWLLWWIPVAAGLVWTQPFALAVTALAGVDGLAGLAMFFAPVLGMAAWVGAVVVALAYERFKRGHLTMASTPTNRGSEVV